MSFCIFVKTQFMKLSFLYVTVLLSANIFGQNVHIPDASFKAYLVGKSAINTNGDSEIQLNEAEAYNEYISCYNLGIHDLTGIEAFINLTVLDCSENQLSSIDLSKNIGLVELNCSQNQLTSLDVSKNTALTILDCVTNQITSLDVNGANVLTELYCYYNQITSLDVSKNNNLTTLECQWNKISSLDLSKNILLERLDCRDLQLKSLDVSMNQLLTQLFCESNPLECVDNVPMNCTLDGAKRCANSFNQTINYIETDYKNDGNRDQIIRLNDGNTVNGIVQFSNGEFKCINGEIVSEKMFYNNGKIKHNMNLKSGEQVGLQEFYFKKGGIKASFYLDSDNENYKNDFFVWKKKQLAVLWEKVYYKNGQLKTEKHFNTLGKWHGEQKYYYKNGQLKFQIFYENGIQKNQDCWDKTGKKINCK